MFILDRSNQLETRPDGNPSNEVNASPEPPRSTGLAESSDGTGGKYSKGLPTHCPQCGKPFSRARRPRPRRSPQAIVLFALGVSLLFLLPVLLIVFAAELTSRADLDLHSQLSVIQRLGTVMPLLLWFVILPLAMAVCAIALLWLPRVIRMSCTGCGWSNKYKVGKNLLLLGSHEDRHDRYY